LNGDISSEDKINYLAGLRSIPKGQGGFNKFLMSQMNGKVDVDQVLKIEQ